MVRKQSIAAVCASAFVVMVAFQNCEQDSKIIVANGSANLASEAPASTPGAAPTSPAPTPAPSPSPDIEGDIASVGTGIDYTCVVTKSGELKCLGNNSEGVFGDGTRISSWDFVPVHSFSIPVKKVVAQGAWSTCALLVDGTVKCWGNNASHNLGDGTLTPSLVPVSVIGLTEPATDITMAYGGCALLQSGIAQCWYTNAALRTFRASDGGKIIYIAAGNEHTCLLTDKRNIECIARDNRNGELGDGTNVGSTTQKLVADVAGQAIGLAVGLESACALLVDGSVKCWGSNLSNALGSNKDELDSRGAAVFSSRPAPVLGLTEKLVKLYSGPGQHTCGLTSERNVYCWGNMLGRRNKIAFKIPELSEVQDISISNAATCFLLKNHRIRCSDRYGSREGGLGLSAEL